jgi:hypothetical protein
MKLKGIIELPSECLYFGRTKYDDDECGFRYIISDTPFPEVGNTLYTVGGTLLRKAIEMFLSKEVSGSFDRRKQELQRQVEVIKKYKIQFPDLEIQSILYEKYNLHP